MSKMVTHQLDARRLLCPLPVIRVQQLIEKLGKSAVGDRIKSICSDPGALYDIPAWAKVHGHKLIETNEIDNEYIIVIEIGDSDD